MNGDFRLALPIPVDVNHWQKKVSTELKETIESHIRERRTPNRAKTILRPLIYINSMFCILLDNFSNYKER